MRKETSATAATPTTSADGSYGLSVGKSEYGRKGSGNNSDLADNERQRRQDRWHRSGRTKRLKSGYARRLDHLSPHGERRGRHTGRYRPGHSQRRSAPNAG